MWIVLLAKRIYKYMNIRSLCRVREHVQPALTGARKQTPTGRERDGTDLKSGKHAVAEHRGKDSVS